MVPIHGNTLCYPCEFRYYNGQGKFKLQMKQCWCEFHSEKKKNYDVETLSLCVNIAKQILYINIPFSELSQRNCKICISQWTGRVGTQLLTSALCFLSRWLNYDHLWNKHNVCLASSTGSLRGSNVIQYVEVFCKL